MILYLAGSASWGDKRLERLGPKEEKKIKWGLTGRLVSYHYIFLEPCDRLLFDWWRKQTMGEVLLFLDSGAFSAWSKSEKAKKKGEKGLAINIDEYIEFIKEHEDELDVYAVLDAIGQYERFPFEPEMAEEAARQTWENQKKMEKAGLKPLPCFHYGEPTKYLKRYVEEYPYIALGGMVPIETEDLYRWLDDMFVDYLCDKDGMPKVKVHGFGMTSVPVMTRYPWYSVDSTSWVLTGRFGSIYVPKLRGGKYDYRQDSWKVCVSNKSPDVKREGKHIDNFARMDREIILDYIHGKGYKLGKSKIDPTPKDKKTYKLKEGERWFGAEEAAATRTFIVESGEYVPNEAMYEPNLVEIVVEDGISNNYKLRDEMNIIYFLDLEKSMPKWPWPYVLEKKIKGFGFKREGK